MKEFNIKEFGAIPGGKVKNTDIFKKVIAKAASQGGGTILIPKGKWLTGPIHLDDNITLYLDDAEILFSQDFEDYLPPVFSRHEGIECYKFSSFIYAYKKKNIRIIGNGILNGQGKPWWDLKKQEKIPGEILRDMADENIPVEERIFVGGEKGYLRPSFIHIIFSEDIFIDGITIKYGAFWTIHPTYCKNVTIKNVKVITEGEYGHTPNGDGIDIDSCNNVLIENCFFDTGDDCIVIKSGRDKDGLRVNIPTENVEIRNCKARRGHGGIVIGSEMSGGVKNIYAHDCEFNGTDRAIRIKTTRERGGYIRDLRFENIFADTLEYEAIIIDMNYTADGFSGRRKGDIPPVLENFYFKNISCNYSKRNIIKIDGLNDSPIKNIYFENINLRGEEGVFIHNAQDIVFKNFQMTSKKVPILNLKDVKNIYFEDIIIKSK